MEIIKDKSYFLKEAIPTYSFGNDREIGILAKKTGVFFIGLLEEYYCFQTVLPIVINGAEGYSYVKIDKNKLNDILQEHYS